ncbi:MAG: hypothetical protein ACHQZR_09010, partial [Candidatus Limnocylindrales bacterium]
MTSQGTRSTTTPPRPSRALVRDRGDRMAGVRIEFDARPVYDFLLSLATVDGLDYDLLPEDGRWLERARAALSTERQQDLADLFGEAKGGGFGHGLGIIPALHPEARSARDFVTLVATMETRQLAREMANDGLGGAVLGLIDRALDG